MFTYNKLQEICSMPETPLCQIMNKNLSDKGNGHHNYTKLYYSKFNDLRDHPINILEIGIGSINPQIPSNMSGGELGKYYLPGASIRGWSDFFTKANIYCCDIDKSILDIFKDNSKIHSFYMDQTNTQSIEDALNGILKDVQFDIIIDDGLHFFPINCNVMKMLFPKLKRNGHYIIEDIIHTEYNYTYVDYSILNKSNYQYVRLPNPKNTVDNNLFIVKNTICI
jgi:hypothetical protein